jgi:hypothetical protein
LQAACVLSEAADPEEAAFDSPHFKIRQEAKANTNRNVANMKRRHDERAEIREWKTGEICGFNLPERDRKKAGVKTIPCYIYKVVKGGYIAWYAVHNLMDYPAHCLHSVLKGKLKGVFGAESFNQVPSEHQAYAAIKAMRDGPGPKGRAIAISAAYEPGTLVVSLTQRQLTQFVQRLARTNGNARQTQSRRKTRSPQRRRAAVASQPVRVGACCAAQAVSQAFQDRQVAGPGVGGGIKFAFKA